MSTPENQKTAEKAIEYSVDIRKAEAGMLKNAMLFNVVKYAQQFDISASTLQDVLTYHYLKRISFTAIMDHIGKTVGLTLAWSTPMTCVSILGLEGQGTKRIMLTQSSPSAPDLNHLTWAIFFHSPTLRKQLSEFGFEEITVDSCPLPLDFISHEEKGLTPYLKSGVVDRLFCVIEKKSSLSLSHESALAELALNTTEVGDYRLYMFSMLKFYVDHYLLMVAPTGEFFDLSTMDLLTSANRKKLFGIATEAHAAQAAQAAKEQPTVLESVLETNEEGETVDVTKFVSELTITDDQGVEVATSQDTSL